MKATKAETVFRRTLDHWTMRVAAFTGFDGLNDLTMQETDGPKPGPTEVVLDVAACSLNSHDLAILEGNFPIVDHDDLPFVSGLDIAGEVAETGSTVDSLSTGDRVSTPTRYVTT